MLQSANQPHERFTDAGLKIAGIECIPFTLPLARPIRFANGELSRTEHVLVRVRSESGLVGEAEAPSRPMFYGESQKSMIAAVERWFAPILIGADPFSIDRIVRRMAKVQHNNTIRAAIDIALHDLLGKALGLPCWKLLGGYADRMRVSYVCGLGEPSAVIAEAEAVEERHGISAFKVKVGGDLDRDLELLRSMRDRLPRAHLHIDGNQGLHAADAIPILRVAEEIGVKWAEEPCRTADRIGRRQVAGATSVPILGDESCRTPEETAREIAEGCIHVLSIKTARSGFRGAADCLAVAEANGLRAAMGSQGDGGMGVLAGLHFGCANGATAALPGDLCFHLNLAGDLLEEPPAIENGVIVLGDTPGLGARISPDKLEHYRIDR